MNFTAVKSRPARPADHLPPGGERLLTRDEAARMLGLRPQTLSNWVVEKKGPRSVLVGSRARRWRLSDILAYIAELETVAAAR
ncbi:helix-turn-helix transcriptional regulator [Brachybacterium sp. AOP29-B2-41]|uniref:helix-turn-helix transcriptional regulator n=1 Tax=Brachybacterium sp. AOP29-B2-41 TaxID=3457704 RepID=UPI004034443A